MLPFSLPYLSLTKFLPDGGEVSFNGYIDKLIKIVRNWPVENMAHCHFSRKQAELYEEYIKKKFGKTPDSWLSGYQGGLSHLVSSNLCSYYSYNNIKSDKLKFKVRFYLTKIPHFSCSLEPPLQERNQFKNLIMRTLSQDIADEIYLNEPPGEITTLGQLHWVYLQNKISQVKKLAWLCNQEKSSGNEPSLVYEFAQQIGKILLPNSTYPLVELRELYPFNPKLSQTEREQREATDKKMLVEFFEKYDQILLETWGKEKFNENLIPLSVSLEEWLNIGKD